LAALAIGLKFKKALIMSRKIFRIATVCGSVVAMVLTASVAFAEAPLVEAPQRTRAEGNIFGELGTPASVTPDAAKKVPIANINANGTKPLPAVRPAEAHGRIMIIGIIKTISGTTLVVESGLNLYETAPVLYTVNAAKAKIKKYVTLTSSGAPLTEVSIDISEISVGDNARIQGTINGTNLEATDILCGLKLGNAVAPLVPRMDGSNVDIKVNAVSKISKPGLWGTIKNFFERLFGKK
jgi:hypothetical protein